MRTVWCYVALPLRACDTLPRREAVELARRKLALEDAAKAKKADFVAGLQAGLNEGGGYRKTPLVVEDFDKEQQEMLRGLEVCCRVCNTRT